MAVLVAVAGFSGCDVQMDDGFDAGPTGEHRGDPGSGQKKDRPRDRGNDVRRSDSPKPKPKPAPKPKPKPKPPTQKWGCFYSPTMNYDWHDDVLCMKGPQEEDRPYLLPSDSYITKDEIMWAAAQYERSLNG